MVRDLDMVATNIANHQIMEALNRLSSQDEGFEISLANFKEWLEPYLVMQRMFNSPSFHLAVYKWPLCWLDVVLAE